MPDRDPVLIYAVYGESVDASSVSVEAEAGRGSLLRKCPVKVGQRNFPAVAGKFVPDEKGWSYIPAQCRYDVYHNKKLTVPDTKIRLAENDVIAYVPKNAQDDSGVVSLLFTSDTAVRSWSLESFRADIASALDPQRFFMKDGELWVRAREDVTVNGSPVTEDTPVRLLDHVAAGNRGWLILSDRIFVSEGTAKQVPAAAAETETPQEEEVRERNVLSVDIRSRKAGNRELLKDIRLEIRPGEMVLIMGGSGAGKTTLVNAIKGDEKAQDASVFFDRYDVYDKNHYQLIQSRIGYVPQKDTMPRGDTVYKTIEDAARMTMRAEMDDPEQLRAHVERALKTFSLQNEQGKLVSKLSGGETKRLSTAKAYVKEPSLFFLDEPDSGLDENSKNQLLAILSHIAHDENKTVIVISHNSLDYGPKHEQEPGYQCYYDKVIVLAKDGSNTGRLAFFGSPHDACLFFEVGSLKEIISRIEPPEKHGEGLADHFVEKFSAGK